MAHHVSDLPISEAALAKETVHGIAAEGQADRRFTAQVWREGEWYVAQALDVEVASQGETRAEAIANLGEALALHFEPPVATETPPLSLAQLDAL